MCERQPISKTQAIGLQTASGAQLEMHPVEGQGMTNNTREEAPDMPYHDYMRRAAQEGSGVGVSATPVYYCGGHSRRRAADASLGTSTSIL